MLSCLSVDLFRVYQKVLIDIVYYDEHLRNYDLQLVAK